MKLPTIIQLVTSPYQARFVRFQDQQLWYEITYPEFCRPDDPPDEFLTFEFPIPVADTDGATFLPEDNPIPYCVEFEVMDALDYARACRVAREGKAVKA